MVSDFVLEFLCSNSRIANTGTLETTEIIGQITAYVLV